MEVILSIKPQYVKEIISGKKRVEFRKTIFKDQEVEKIYIYSSYPQKEIVGLFFKSNIFHSSPERLWDKFKENAGIDKEDFFEYFKKKNSGYAIEISGLKIFHKPLDPKLIFEEFIAPQSFCYFNDEEIQRFST